MLKLFFNRTLTIATAILLISAVTVLAQPERRTDNRVRTVTVPISIFTREELKNRKISEFIEAGDLIVREDGDEQVILSIQSTSENPLELAILIQDDLDSTVNLELKRLGDFIRRLPSGSRVMVAYLRGGSVQVRQRFTQDLEKAANSLRIITGSLGGGGNPYEGISEAVKRFDALPTGRRAILLVSNGFDTLNGAGNFASLQSSALERAISNAQRRSVAVYSFYSNGAFTQNANSTTVLTSQGLLQKLSDETGGRTFFQGTQSPVSFDPFFKELNLALTRQFALTYLSTHMKKGYHKIQITSTNPQVKIEHPKGYYYR
jgi:VWFA-related protein